MKSAICAITALTSLIGGGFAGSVFTWYMTRPEPTLVTYSVTSAAVRADSTVKSAVPNLKIQVGGEEITGLYTHTVEFSVPRAYVERAEAAITFPDSLNSIWFPIFERATESRGAVGSPGAGEMRIFGMTSEAPSSVQHIECKQLKNGAQCSLGPLTPSTEGKFSVTIATNQFLKPHVQMVARGVELMRSEDFVAREATSWRNVSTSITPYIGALVGPFFGVLASLLVWRVVPPKS